MNDELKPCPFCGGEAKLYSTDGWGFMPYYVKCTECGVRTQTMDNAHRENKTTAINAWNRGRE